MKLKMFFGVCGVVLVCLACGGGKGRPVLGQKEFTALLIDMHATDGILGVSRGSFTADREKRNYTYYNGVFEKYGITRADFDSCMYFYAAQPEVFTKIYEVVIDSLSRRVTAEERVLQKLRENDSLNYYRGPDTLRIDSFPFYYEYVADSLLPGNYKFEAMVRFDTLDAGKDNRIRAWFVSADEKDSLKVRDIKLISDTLAHRYQWTQYADSVYSRLVIRFLDADNLEKLKYRRADVWGITLFRPYTSPKNAERLEKNLSSRRGAEREKLQKAPADGRLLHDRGRLKRD